METARQWLEEQTRPGEKDYETERDRAAREERLGSDGDNDKTSRSK